MKYFEVKYSYSGINDDGKDVVFKERVVLQEAQTFGSTEEMVYRLAEERSLADISIEAIKTVKSNKPIFDEQDSKWYVAQVKFFSVDDSGKAKSVKENNLVQRETPEKVIEKIHELYKDTMFGYEIINVKESGINEII